MCNLHYGANDLLSRCYSIATDSQSSDRPTVKRTTFLSSNSPMSVLMTSSSTAILYHPSPSSQHIPFPPESLRTSLYMPGGRYTNLLDSVSGSVNSPRAADAMISLLPKRCLTTHDVSNGLSSVKISIWTSTVLSPSKKPSGVVVVVDVVLVVVGGGCVV